jgi:putative endonuclease
MSGAVAYYGGKAAEAQVAAAYERKGCAIAARRWRGQGGEIDLIARDGEVVVFVEVKKSSSHARAAAQLSPRQMQRICCAASEFIASEPHGQNSHMRFDVALVDALGCIEILENAFGLE